MGSDLDNLFISIDNYKYIASSDLNILKPYFARFDNPKYNKNFIREVKELSYNTYDMHIFDIAHNLNLSYILKYPDVLKYKFEPPMDDAELFCRIQILKHNPKFQPWIELWFQHHVEKLNAMSCCDEQWPIFKWRAYQVCQLEYYADILERFMEKYPVIPDRLAERFKFYLNHTSTRSVFARGVLDFIINRKVSTP
jgi:hypothetical protein